MIRIRKHGTVIASFATPQEIVISHANDTIRLGDGTDLMSWSDVGGTKCMPVDVKATTGATSANQTNGTQKVQIWDPGVADGGTAEVDLVGAERALKVSVISSVGGGAAPAFTDDAAFTVGSTQLTPIGAMFDDVATDSVDEGDVGVLRMTADRMLKIQLASVLAGVAVPITDNAGSLTIDNANLDVALSTLATAAKQDTQTTSLQLIDDVIFTDDAAFTPATSKVAMIGAQCDEAATDSVDEGDAGALRMTADRQLYVKLGTALPAGTNNIGDVDVLTLPALPAGTNNIGDVDVLTLPALPAGTNNIGDVDVLTLPGITGAAAHDAATSGNPVLMGYQARTTALPTAVSAAGDAANAISDEYGRALHAGFFAPGMIGYQAPSAITNTTETTIVTADASNCLDIISLIITNNSDVQSLATLKDSTAGTTRAIFLVPARGGVVHNPNTPMPQATKNNNWTLTMGTTATSTNVSVMFGKRPT